MSDIEIRLCKTWDECVQCEEMQKRVWEMADYRDAVPANLLSTAIKNGGILVGAFEGEQMIGFAFGFLGSEGAGNARRLKHTSHMLGVLPNARVKGIGAQMKWLQRVEAIKQGLDLITWTYDPLQAVNAYLNLTRLGAIARRYARNAYGDMTDALNRGVASDRFEVEWYLKSERVAGRETMRENSELNAHAQLIYQIEWDATDLPHILEEAAFERETISVEIPTDFQAMKARNRALAIQWRERTRTTFERAFASGYVACEVARKTDRANRPRVYYVLEKAFKLA